MKLSKNSIWKDRSCVPCSITLGNALCGLTAVIYMGNHDASATSVPVMAIWLILAAIIFDAFDGYAARKLKAESAHGMELDSLSDVLSFGMAPAVLIYFVGKGGGELAHPFMWVSWLAAGFYMVCAIWRLAQYNTMALSGNSSKSIFTGLPTPAAAAMLCSMLLLFNYFNLDARLTGLVAMAYAFTMGGLMVSEIEYNHTSKIIGSIPPALRSVLLVLLTAMVVGLHGSIFLIFFAVMHIYLLYGMVAFIQAKRSEAAVKLS